MTCVWYHFKPYDILFPKIHEPPKVKYSTLEPLCGGWSHRFAAARDTRHCLVQYIFNSVLLLKTLSSHSHSYMYSKRFTILYIKISMIVPSQIGLYVAVIGHIATHTVTLALFSSTFDEDFEKISNKMNITGPLVIYILLIVFFFFCLSFHKKIHNYVASNTKWFSTHEIVVRFCE